MIQFSDRVWASAFFRTAEPGAALEADRRLHSPDRVADAGIIEAGKADSKSSAAILFPGKAAAG